MNQPQPQQHTDVESPSSSHSVSSVFPQCSSYSSAGRRAHSNCGHLRAVVATSPFQQTERLFSQDRNRILRRDCNRPEQEHLRAPGTKAGGGGIIPSVGVTRLVFGVLPLYMLHASLPPSAVRGYLRIERKMLDSNAKSSCILALVVVVVFPLKNIQDFCPAPPSVPTSPY